MREQRKEVIIDGVRYVPEAEAYIEATVGSIMQLDTADGSSRKLMELLEPTSGDAFRYGMVPAGSRVRIHFIKE